MSALPLPAAKPNPTRIVPRDPSPDYLPARMVNEFVYCPRLFFYEWVEGVFRESADTLEGSAQHIGAGHREDRRPIAREVLNDALPELQQNPGIDVEEAEV